MKPDEIEQTASEAAFIDRFTADCCRPHAEALRMRMEAFAAARQAAFFGAAAGTASFALAAGDSAPAASAAAPAEDVRFVFASEGAEDAPGAWRAELLVPARAVPDTMLAVRVADGAGSPAEGALRLSGVTLPLADGRAELPFGLFLAGIADTGVFLRRPDGTETPGRLLFF